MANNKEVLGRISKFYNVILYSMVNEFIEKYWVRSHKLSDWKYPYDFVCHHHKPVMSSFASNPIIFSTDKIFFYSFIILLT